MNDVERDGSKSIGFQLRGQMFGSNPNVQTIQGSSLGAIHEPILVAERLQCPNKSLGGCWEVLHSPGLELVLGLSKLKRHPPTCTKTYLHTVNADDVGVSDEDVSLELRRYDETEPFRLAVTFDPAFVSLSSFFKFPALDITSSLGRICRGNRSHFRLDVCPRNGPLGCGRRSRNHRSHRCRHLLCWSVVKPILLSMLEWNLLSRMFRGFCD
mmetsp:Transcript_10500/g.23115  ORF Transcript_10500/g.23115 Transcript_10500/m.23115 type:complete len:212 (+) Transcript_10500:923-1558(+)